MLCSPKTLRAAAITLPLLLSAGGGNGDIQGLWRVAMPVRGPGRERDRQARLPKSLLCAAVRSVQAGEPWGGRAKEP